MKIKSLLILLALLCAPLDAMEEDPQFCYCSPTSPYFLSNGKSITFEPTYDDEEEDPFFLTLHDHQPQGIAYGLSPAKGQAELVDLKENGTITGIDASEDLSRIAVCRENGIITIFSTKGAKHRTTHVTSNPLLAIKFLDNNKVGAYSQDKLYIWDLGNDSMTTKEKAIQMPKSWNGFTIAAPFSVKIKKD